MQKHVLWASASPFHIVDILVPINVASTLKANAEIARLTRAAIDAVPNGTDAILSSEGYADVFHPHTQMSLTMFYPGVVQPPHKLP
jgi:hypothetical protein